MKQFELQSFVSMGELKDTLISHIGKHKQFDKDCYCCAWLKKRKIPNNLEAIEKSFKVAWK